MSLFNKTGLVAWYPMTEGSGTTLNDYQGTNNGTLTNGPTWQKEKDGGYSIKFDGSDDYMTFSSAGSFPTGNEMTVVFWNYGVTAKYSFLLQGIDSSNNRVFGIHLPWSDGNVYWDCGNTTITYDRINKTVVATEYQGWHFWCFTKNAVTGVMKIFLDGIEWHSDTNKTKTINIANTVTLCTTPNGLGSYHQGKLRNILIFEKELNLNEIKDLYRKTYIE